MSETIINYRATGARRDKCGVELVSSSTSKALTRVAMEHFASLVSVRSLETDSTYAFVIDAGPLLMVPVSVI